MAQHGEEVQFEVLEHESEDQAKAGSLAVRKLTRRNQRAAQESTFLIFEMKSGKCRSFLQRSHFYKTGGEKKKQKQHKDLNNIVL